MTWNVTVTFLASILGGTMLVFTLYGIYVHVLPHLRRPGNNPDVTIPQAQQPADTRLQESLYSLRSLNYIDPRNSIADTELKSSRWSTNLQDLSQPASPVLTAPPWSSGVYVEDSSHHNSRPPTCARHGSTSILGYFPLENGQGTRRAGQQRHLTRQKSQSMPQTMASRTISVMHRSSSFRRLRSRSDTVVPTRRGLLASSHTMLWNQNSAAELLSPTLSTFSGTTLLFDSRMTQHVVGRRSTIHTERVEIPYSLGKSNRTIGAGSTSMSATLKPEMCPALQLTLPPKKQYQQKKPAQSALSG